MIDKPKCDQILSNLAGYLDALKRLRDVPRETFLEDPDKIASAKYNFVVAIEACLDAANHIISSERYRLPKDNADSFRVLSENDIVSAESLPALVAMARFRNAGELVISGNARNSRLPPRESSPFRGIALLPCLRG